MTTEQSVKPAELTMLSEALSDTGAALTSAGLSVCCRRRPTVPAMSDMRRGGAAAAAVDQTTDDRRGVGGHCRAARPASPAWVGLAYVAVPSTQTDR